MSTSPFYFFNYYYYHSKFIALGVMKKPFGPECLIAKVEEDGENFARGERVLPGGKSLIELIKGV